jgi:NADPH2:quinone reductase
LCLPETQAVPLPDSASFDLGASLGIPALTAHRTLFADGSIDDATILITGGAGAVGQAAIQLGRRAGARIITTVSSTEKAEVAEAAGAHTVINYRDPDTIDQIRAAAPGGIRRIIDVAPTANTPITTAILDPDGTIVTYANDGPLPLMAHMGANTTIRFVLVYTMGTAAIDAAVSGTSGAVADGAFRTLPITRFSLQETAAAHDAVEANTVGKVLIDID